MEGCQCTYSWHDARQPQARNIACIIGLHWQQSLVPVRASYLSPAPSIKPLGAHMSP